MANFWLEKEKPGKFSGGANYLHFDSGWKREKIAFNDDELDELRRVLGVGMGDCDHCEAWKDWSKPMSDEKRIGLRERAIISHDMKHFVERMDALESLITKVENRLNDVGKNATYHLKRHDKELHLIAAGVAKLIKDVGDLPDEVELLKLALVTVNHRAEEDRKLGQSKPKPKE
jgi:hypothetical protein